MQSGARTPSASGRDSRSLCRLAVVSGRPSSRRLIRYRSVSGTGAGTPPGRETGSASSDTRGTLPASPRPKRACAGLEALGTRQNPGAPHRFPVKDPARPWRYRASLVRVLMKSGWPPPMAGPRPAEAERAARTPLGLNIGVGAAAAVVAAALVAAAVPQPHEMWRWETVAAAVAIAAAVTVDRLAMAAVVP